MRKTALLLVAVATLLGAPAVAKAQGFLIGLVVGGTLFGGSSSPGGAFLVWTADEDTLKKTPAGQVRFAVYRDCFSRGVGDGAGKSLDEMFAHSTAKLPRKERTVLQIFRVFESLPNCAGIWFTYIEK